MLAEIFMLRLEALSRNLNGLARSNTRFKPIVPTDTKYQAATSSEPVARDPA
jgi:hypothetical protein